MIKTGLDLSHGIFFLVPATVLSGMRNAAVLQKFVSRSFCVFAHNWHFIFCSSTTTTFVQIFRLQTDNWVFISKLYQELFTVWLSHPIISLYSLTTVPECYNRHDNYKMISRSLTTLSMQQRETQQISYITQLISGNQVKFIQNNPVTVHTQSQWRLTRNKFKPSWSIYGALYGPLMGLCTSLQMFHWTISGYMDHSLTWWSALLLRLFLVHDNMWPNIWTPIDLSSIYVA